MDIYSYLNSPDVAAYCREIGYTFNAAESAFIVNDCRRISIEEKHRLYREIMATMQDMPIKNIHLQNNTSEPITLFPLLKKLIRKEDRILKRMKTGKEGWFYTFYQ